jgi:hypothetical protein
MHTPFRRAVGHLDLVGDLEGTVFVAETGVVERGIGVFGREHALNVKLLILLGQLELILGLSVVLLILRGTAVRLSGRPVAGVTPRTQSESRADCSNAHTPLPLPDLAKSLPNIYNPVWGIHTVGHLPPRCDAHCGACLSLKT